MESPLPRQTPDTPNANKIVTDAAQADTQHPTQTPKTHLHSRESLAAFFYPIPHTPKIAIPT